MRYHYQKNLGRFYLESLEERRFLSAVPFTNMDLEETVISGEVTSRDNTIVGDINGDGNTDIVRFNPRQIRMLAGNADGTLNPPLVIGDFPNETVLTGRSIPELIDLDADGDLDIVARRFDAMLLYENTDGQGTLAPAEVIGGPIDQFGIDDFWVTDVNQDGYQDLVALEIGGKLQVYQSGGDVSLSKGQSLHMHIPSQGDGTGFVMRDFDLDGDDDFAVASHDGILVLTNLDGTYHVQEIQTDGTSDFQIDAADYDGDGDDDIFIGGRTAVVVENDLALGAFVPGASQDLVEDDFSFRIRDAVSFDIDRDVNDELIVENWRNTPNVIFKANSDLVFEKVGEADFLFENFVVGDFDAELGEDVIEIDLNRDVIRQLELVDGELIRTRALLGGTSVSRATSAQFVDWDADDDLDVVLLGATDGEIVWYEYDSMARQFDSRKTIAAEMNAATYSRAFDFDLDGDLDLLVSDLGGRRLGMLQNTDGSVGELREIVTLSEGNQIANIDVVDMDGDRIADVVFSIAAPNVLDNELVWLKGEGGGEFSNVQTIVTGMATEFAVGNMDGIGNLDIATSTPKRNPVVVFGDRAGTYRQTIASSAVDGHSVSSMVAVGDLNGDGLDEPLYDSDPIGYLHPRKLEPAGEESWTVRGVSMVWGAHQPVEARAALLIVDVNADGKQDVLTNELAWFENTGAGEQFRWTAQFDHGRGMLVDESIIAGDFDQDGDNDFLAYSPDKAKLTVFRNETISQTLRGDFDRDGRIAAADIDILHRAIRLQDGRSEFDVNLDGSVNEEDRLSFVRDIANTSAGDANLDGRFDSTDLILIMRSAGYEKPDFEATWATGDFDGDGRFGTSDLVAAFRSGNYII